MGRLFLQALAMVAEFEAGLGHLRISESMAPASRHAERKVKAKA